MKRLFWWVLSWIILYLIIFHLLPFADHKYSRCLIYDDIYQQDFKLKVVKKFTDPARHNNYVIIYINSDGQQQYMEFIDVWYVDMYNYISVGDSIIKKQKTVTYKVVSPNSKVMWFKMDTGCKDTIK